MEAVAEHKKLSPAGAAVRANRSEYTILGWVRKGLLKATRDPISRRLTIDPADLDRLLAGPTKQAS